MLEEKLAAVDSAATEASTHARELSSAIKKIQRASSVGDLSRLDRSLHEGQEVARHILELLDNLAELLNFDQETYLSSEAFLGELIAAAESIGLCPHRVGNVLYSFPVTLRINSNKRTLLLGEKRQKHLRPKAVASYLKKLQISDGRQSEERFLEDLYSAYRLLVGLKGLEANGYETVIALSDVFKAMTLRSCVEYSRQDFSIDLYRLDKSGLHKTKAGAIVSLPASTGTRNVSETFSVISEHGQELRYYGVAFMSPGVI